MENKRVWLRGACALSGGMLLFAWLYRQGKREEALMGIVLGLAGAAALFYLPLQKKKEEAEKRRAALSREYSGLITMLSLYMTAGLSLRSSWERMVRGYEQERKAGAPRREAWEEMLQTWREIRGGEYEERAYGNFGRRCGTAEYLRLGGLLETYVQQGNKELLMQLEQEASASMVMALQNIKQKGEQTSTRLLLPLLLLFGLSLLMVMVPALMSMQNSIS